MTNSSRGSLNVTPSPRLLEVIGDVDLQIWQCLAELVDNAFDEGLANPDMELGAFIQVPKASSVDPATAEVIVSDTGPGMAADQLERALTAGSSGKGRFGTLGLFGMGFNVATARLGNLTEVWTGRQQDSDWIVATIDLRAMQRSETFEIPLRMEPKKPGEHGTKVVVSQLRAEVLQDFRRPSTVKNIRAVLGDVYSYILRDPSNPGFSGSDVVGGLGLSMTLNGQPVLPKRPCIYDPSRYVTRQGTQIPAVIPIDKVLDDRVACMSCGHWNDLNVDSCAECESTNVEVRGRRIHGWVGVQRYLSTTDFGIDVLRNGRKILRKHKEFFAWHDDLNGTDEVEYPVEVPSQNGRIVGEIHVDHVPVNYRKTDFDRDSRDWADLRRALRGDSPLRPRIAAERGFTDPNVSPVAQLFTGYRRNEPGLGDLVPGDGTSPLHARAREWAVKFGEGDPDFLTDLAWFEAAKLHDQRKRGEVTQDDLAEEGRAALIAAGLGDILEDQEEEGSPDTDTQPPGDAESDSERGDARASGTELLVETEAERLERYRSVSFLLLGLGATLTLPGTDNGFVLCARGTRNIELVDGDGRPVTTFSRFLGGELEVFVDEDDEWIAEFGRDPRDIALIEAADRAKLLFHFEDRYSTVDLVRHFTRQLDDLKVTDEALRGRIASVLESIRDRACRLTSQAPGETWGALSPEAKTSTELAALDANPSVDWALANANGDFGRYLTLRAVADLVDERPAAMLDGGVFRRTYKTWSSDEHRQRTAREVSLMLRELDDFLNHTGTKRPAELKRAQITVDLVRNELVDG